ncbi:MAG TPA: sigma-70 family RNA polymerase sigma factor [Thermoanaerobaculia bacterium]|nr:sigma-70 family RNA polymerase sigma factor [Thermoanaerobaculia bacterium]
MAKDLSVEGMPASVTGVVGATTKAPPFGRSSAGQIYLEHGPLMRRVAIRKFNVPPMEAEALVHDVFINFLLTARNVRTDLRAYLIAAICNASRNYWRSRRTEDRVFADAGATIEELATDDDLFEGLAMNLMVASTLAKLGERCREALKRYYLDGEDTVSIAAAMNTTPSNINYQMHLCRKRARSIYERIARTSNV